MAKHPELRFSISYTTRPKRHNEVHGADYLFVDRDEFNRLREAGEMLEWAEVFDNFYATSRSKIETLLAEGHEPHSVDWLWVMGGPDPDMAVDITPQFDRKVAALSSHSSQVAWIEDIHGFLANWARDTSKRHGLLDQAELVEAFRKVKTS